MAQYCRYCNNMVCGDANYCTVKEATLSDSYICRTNKCNDFEFNEIDALDHSRTYKPRKEKQEISDFEQLYWSDAE